MINNINHSQVFENYSSKGLFGINYDEAYHTEAIPQISPLARKIFSKIYPRVLEIRAPDGRLVMCIERLKEDEQD